MALEQSIWIPTLQEQMRPLNEFLKNSVDETAFIEGKTVIRPIEGDEPEVLLNTRGVQGTQTLNDAENSYNMNNLRTKATTVEDVEEIELSYDKRAAILKRHSTVLNLRAVNYMLHLWSPTTAAAQLRTTGAAAPATLVGATGTRLKITLSDFAKANLLLDDMDVPTDRRQCLMPASWYQNFLLDNKEDLLDLSKYGKAVLQDGELEMLFGIKIYRRGKKNLTAYTNAGTPVPKSPFAVRAVTDNAAAIFWHSDCVGSALGGYKMYESPDADLQGTKVSARLRIGGKPIYTDETGVIAIVETA
jgi:hypothetical protein